MISVAAVSRCLCAIAAPNPKFQYLKRTYMKVTARSVACTVRNFSLCLHSAYYTSILLPRFELFPLDIIMLWLHFLLLTNADQCSDALKWCVAFMKFTMIICSDFINWWYPGWLLRELQINVMLIIELGYILSLWIPVYLACTLLSNIEQLFGQEKSIKLPVSRVSRCIVRWEFVHWKIFLTVAVVYVLNWYFAIGWNWSNQESQFYLWFSVKSVSL